MACSSAVSTLNSVSVGERGFETGTGIPPGGFSASSSPDGFRADLETTYVASGKDLRHSRTLESRAGGEISPTSAIYADNRQTYASLAGSWYPQTTDYYAVSAATGYSTQTASQRQTTCSAVTWPSDDVKPTSFVTSFVLSPPPTECNANCRQSYCKER